MKRKKRAQKKKKSYDDFKAKFNDGDIVDLYLMCSLNSHLANQNGNDDFLSFANFRLLKENSDCNILNILKNAKWVKIISILMINSTLDYYYYLNGIDSFPQIIRYLSGKLTNSRGNFNIN